MFETVQRYLGPSLKVTALDCYGDQHATNLAYGSIWVFFEGFSKA